MDPRIVELATSLLEGEEVSKLQRLLINLQTNRDSTHGAVLADTLRCSSSSYLPLTVLYAICTKSARPWPAFDLCRQFWQCWRALPEAAKAGRGPERAHVLIHKTLALVNNSYSSFNSLLHPSSTEPAIINPDTGSAIAHDALAQVLNTYALPVSTTKKPVVAISLPNGPLLAITLLATATYYTAAPIAYGSGVGIEQFKRDVLQSGSDLVLAWSADVDRLKLHDAWLHHAGIKVLLVELSKSNQLVFRNLDQRQIDTTTWPRSKPNHAGDIAVLLFTSGTSGSKKLVPLHVETLVTGVAMVQSSWGLSSSSRCLNQMPLNHVGGIVRNLFAPIMSGGSVICCSGFDANGFWDAVDDHAPTWYYASPTMHQCILEAAEDRPETVAKSQIKLICNAAGGLLPSLAIQLRDTFSRPGLECTVLPSYGMTECMPISTPPLTYKLEKTGTSGISVGPEIAILDGQDKHMKTGSIGRIAVRGAPVFAGYLKEGQLDRMCFTKDAWFDTGDMGYLDGDGSLYITGRSKEVINRGGELISPFEVEDAVLAAAKDPRSPIYGTITKALAFSANHDVLQEVVGLIVVTPADKKRPCLKTIQEATKSSLASVKVPVLLVYMNDGVPTNNNKVLRIRLAERLNLPIQTDSTPQQQRYYEAICPEPNTALTTNIRSRPLPLSTKSLQTSCRLHIPSTMDFFIRILPTEIHPELWVAPKVEASKRATWSLNAAERLREKFAADLDAYFVPSRVEHKESPFVRRADGSVDIEALLPSPVPAPAPSTAWQGPSQTQTKVSISFAETLGLQAHTIGENSDFFELGGDSMKAGRLLSALRKTFNMRLTIDLLFKHSTVGALARLIDEKGPIAPSNKPKQATDGLIKSLPGCTKTCSSTNPFLLALQLVPICIVAPLRRALTWTMFIYCLTFSQNLLTSDSLPGRFINLVMSLLLGKIFAEAVAPIFAILCKWLIIGRYQEGMYPMWGSYHTRWWLVQKIISIGGLGIYEHFGFTRILYYKALGVSIGRNVSIDKEAKLGEYDLISIGDGVILDACTVRPFAAERNTSMYLGRIRIGMGSSIGLASIVAAGTTVPSNTCIGPNSSSWELEDAIGTNRDLSPTKIRQPCSLLTYLIGLPVVTVAAFIGAIPWMGGLFPLILTEPKQNTADHLRETIIWFAGPNRVAWHYVALACNAAIGPLFFFAAVIGVKRVLDSLCGGPAQPGPAKEQSQLLLLRSLIMRTLMPDKQFHRVTALFGTHYESTSWFARQLGSKIGKHVYWPGKGPTTQDWDMLEIDDNVVFGSRSHIITSDAKGTSKVKIGKGAMVADRVVLLPGSELGRNTIMGSGALAMAHKTYPDDTTWVGSKAGDAICLKAEAIDDPVAEPVLGARFRQYRNTIDGRESMYRRPYRDTIDAQVSLYNYMNDSQTTIRKTPYDSRMSSLYDLGVDSDETLHNEKSAVKEPTTLITAVSPIVHHDDSSPFGRAFYQGKASYRVWGQFGIFCYSTFLTVLTATFWNIHSISAIQIVAYVYRHPSWYGEFLQASAYRPFVIYIFFSGLIAGIFAVQIMLVLGVIITAKWILMGRRKQGNYDWDKSPYCQRWQLLLKIEALRQKCYGGHGILGLLTGTNWVVQYFRALGANIGKDCALFASGTPSLYFTEPDLLTLGDRVSVDDASLVCHINTRGKFDLNPLVVGDRSVLRTGSRLLSGARMEADSCLLEHTLVMAGDIVDAETARQGWPGEEFDGNRLPTLRVAYYWETA